MNNSLVISDLKILEGFKATVYKDTRGYDTIGYGTCIDARCGGLSKDYAELLLQHRLDLKIEELDTAISWWRMLDDVRQDVIAEMAYQLGTEGLLEFNEFLAYAKAKQYDLAAGQMLNSQWAQETPERAKMLSQRFATGKVE